MYIGRSAIGIPAAATCTAVRPNDYITATPLHSSYLVYTPSHPRSAAAKLRNIDSLESTLRFIRLTSYASRRAHLTPNVLGKQPSISTVFIHRVVFFSPSLSSGEQDQIETTSYVTGLL